MKRHLMGIMIIIVGMLFLTTNSYAKNKYDVLLKDEGIRNQINYVDTKVKGTFLMDYLNAIISSPKEFYKILEEYECEDEILDFVKKNKSFSLKMTHVYIIMILNDLKVKDSELMYVTNYIRNPNSSIASNHQEKGIELSMMRAMPVFRVYEGYTKPGGLKEQVEEMFHNLVK